MWLEVYTLRSQCCLSSTHTADYSREFICVTSSTTIPSYTCSACMSDFWVVSDGKFRTVAMYWILSAGRHSTRNKLTFLYQCIIDPCQNWFHYSPTGLAQIGWSKAHQYIANHYIQLLPNPEYTKSYQSRLMFLYITNCAPKGIYRCVSYYTVISSYRT